MPDPRRFFAAAPRVRFTGTVYRICLELHRNSIASMRGAFLHGGRYNIRRYFGCLYTALEMETARAEVQRYLTVPPDIGLVEAAIELRLSQIVDLTESSVRRRVGLRGADLTGEQAICQELGLRAWESGIEALLVPSAAVRGAKNLAVFLDNQSPGWGITLSGASLTSSA